MRLVERYSSFVYRRPGIVLFVAALLLAPALWAASRLGLKTDFKDLLPRNRPSVVEMDRLADRLDPGVSLQIAVEGEDLPAMERLADDVAARLRALPPGLIERVDESFRAERAFLERNRWLYASLGDLTAANDALERRVIAETPFDLGLSDKDTDASTDLDGIERRLRAKASEWDRFPDGYYVGENGRLLAVFVTVASSTGTDFPASRRLLERIRAEVDALGPRSYHPSLRVTLAGDLVVGLREYDSLKADVLLASSLCLLLVLGVIVLFYGNLRSIFILGGALVVGVGWTFGFTRLVIGYLNTSTAFLGSIVAGNGINFGIILLARYFEERRRGSEAALALGIAIRRTAPATAGAALAASIAYGSLMVTDFRGFNQFGVIGGVGMLLCWIAAYTVGPALIAVSERISWLARRSARPWRDPLSLPFLSLLRRAPRAAIVIPALAIALGSSISVHFLSQDPFEYDFRRLRSTLPDPDGVVALGKRTSRIRSLGDDAVIALVTRPEQARELAQAIEARRNHEGEGTIDRAFTLGDLIPEAQPEKLALLAHMRGVIDKVAPNLDERDRISLLAQRPPADLHVLGIADLPPKLRAPFTEKDGTAGRVVAIAPPPGHSSWDGRFLLRFAGAVEETQLPDGSVVRAAGRPIIFADIIRSVFADAPRAVFVSMLGVIVLVIGTMRRSRPALLVLAALFGGLAVMLGVAVLAGMRLNFLNFVAIPITIGVGADYAINMMRRHLDEPGRTPEGLLATTGGALVLCSLTTTIGYGTLLVAANRAIASFGLLAALGEVACLVTALVLLPSILQAGRRARLPETPANEVAAPIVFAQHGR